MNILVQLNQERSQRLRALAKDKCADIAGQLWGEPNRKLSTANSCRWGTHGSKVMQVNGDKAGYWYDHEFGRGGDAIELLMLELNCSFADALNWIENIFGTTKAPTQTLNNTASALAIWQESKSPVGTLVEQYLHNRRCWHSWLSSGEAIRFHSSCPDGGTRSPAMIALMTNIATGEPTGIHRTYLLPDGLRRKENGKKCLGGKSGSIIKLKDEDGPIGIIAEGIENALTAAHFHSNKVISAIDCGNLSKIGPIPNISQMAIFADPKEQEQRAAFIHAARCRLASVNCQVLRPKSAFHDLNDLALEA